MSTGLAVIHPGQFSTIQDRGRTGLRASGVPLGGAFDRGSADLANALLGNPENAAVLEMTFVGGVYEARAMFAVALAGAAITATVRDRDGAETWLRGPVCFSLHAGDRLDIGGSTRGARAYLAVVGGWRTPVVLGSRSSEEAVEPGVVLPCASSWSPVRRPRPDLNPFETVDASPLRVIDGPDAGLLPAGSLAGSAEYRVGTSSDRMGLRLEGPSWDYAADPDRVSCAVAPGAVQAVGGRPLVLGVACGTMGGYSHVAHVISADLDRLAQARPGDRVRFERVTLAEARRLDREARRRTSKRRAHVATAAADVG